MKFVVREAKQQDAQLIAELTRAAWADKVAVTSSGHRETAIRVADDLRIGGAFILLTDNIPIGSIRWIPLESEPDIWEILRVGLLTAYRGKNLSQYLVEAVIHHALTVGASELRLAIRVDQPRLLDFYAAFGFELAPELEYSHANPLEPAPSVMRRHLKS